MPTQGSAAWPPWPPEVPPYRPPGPPPYPPGPPPYRPEPPAPPHQPVPILPSWEEPGPAAWERDVADRLLEQRVIVVGGRLDDALANRVTAELLLLDGQDAEPIQLHLSCPDAELDAALALAGTVDMLASPVHAVVRGIVRGPALALLCVAEESAAYRHAVLVLSLPPPMPEPAAGDLTVLAEQRERQLDRMRRLICERARRDEDEVAADLKAGRVLSADEALSYGLLDRVL